MTNHEFAKALLLTADDAKSSSLLLQLQGHRYQVVSVATVEDLRRRLKEETITLVVAECDGAFRSVLGVIKEAADAGTGVHLTRWCLVGDASANVPKSDLLLLGVVAFLPPRDSEGRADQLAKALDRLRINFADPFREVVEVLEGVTGVQLAKDKRSLVDSRLQKRMHTLGIETLSDYASYFHRHRRQEVAEAISLVTTHTTEFFREEAHFDELFDTILPRLLRGRTSVSIWSAACSTGQEVYSIAIAVLECCEHLNLFVPNRPAIHIYGSDIDRAVVQIAQEGIYTREQIAGVPKSLVAKYFDAGVGELSGFFRIKDVVHKLCEFCTTNLLTDAFSHSEIDLVFLRNTMIYFKPDDVSEIVTKVSKTLCSDGRLFLGHSESLAGLVTPFVSEGNSIYALKSGQKLGGEARHRRASPVHHNDLILVGASTGGVEALRVVLEAFRPGCPPILIVQHIPEVFSATLAKRLNETCSIEVTEARDGELAQSSHAYIAPGNKQMRLVRTGNKIYIEINDDPAVGRHKPSVDYLFKSASSSIKNLRVSAALLTGMGEDGALGLNDLRVAGAHTVVQDEATSVVFGMPGAAIRMGAALEVLPLQKIAEALQLPSLRKASA